MLLKLDFKMHHLQHNDGIKRLLRGIQIIQYKRDHLTKDKDASELSGGLEN